MDARPFSGLRHEGYDIAVAYDYRSLTAADEALLESYGEICVVAWSFGVPAAQRFLRLHPGLPVTARVAVNGTLFPVDDHSGIPVAIFEGTLTGLSGATLTKFRRRMCGSSQAFATFSLSAPLRTDIEELASELRAIRDLERPAADGLYLWDTVYISASDRIIPADNQRVAWEGHRRVIEVDGPHLPDFEMIISRSLRDKTLIAERFAASSDSYEDEAAAQRQIALRLARLTAEAAAERRVTDLLEIGAGTGMLTRALVESLHPVHLTLWDIAPIADELPGDHRRCDAEAAISHLEPSSLDMIASSSTFQWFNSPRRFVANCLKALRPGGLLAFATFGPDNFRELNSFIHSPLNYMSLGEWVEILSAAGFIIESATEETIVKDFTDTRSLLRHISLTGVNALTSTPSSPSTLRAIINSGIASLTYHPLYLIAKTQPKPRQ